MEGSKRNDKEVGKLPERTMQTKRMKGNEKKNDTEKIVARAVRLIDYADYQEGSVVRLS